MISQPGFVYTYIDGEFTSYFMLYIRRPVVRNEIVTVLIFKCLNEKIRYSIVGMFSCSFRENEKLID